MNGIHFGNLIRVRADDSKTARAFAQTYRDLKVEEDSARMVDTAQFDDMPGDCFIFTGRHWRDSMSAMSDTIRDMLTRPVSHDEHRDAERRVADKRHEMVLDALAAGEDMETLDLREHPDNAAPLPEAFRVVASATPEGTARHMKEVGRRRQYLVDEFCIDPRTMTGFSPNHEPSASYLFWGDAFTRFHHLAARAEADRSLDFPSTFRRFIDSLNSMKTLWTIELPEEVAESEKTS